MKLTKNEQALVLIFAMFGFICGLWYGVQMVLLMQDFDRINSIYESEYFFLFDKYHNH